MSSGVLSMASCWPTLTGTPFCAVAGLRLWGPARHGSAVCCSDAAGCGCLLAAGHGPGS